MKKYISPGSWFVFSYPENWHEFQDSEENGFLFYNPDVWSGNFRISAALDASPHFAEEAMHDELCQYANARKVTINNRHFIYSFESFEEEGRHYTSHFWVTGERNMVVYCSFTMDEKGKLEEAEALLSTLQILNPKKPCLHEIIPVRLMEVALINEAYECALKTVKQELKRDFSSSTIETSIELLQKLADKGVKTVKDFEVTGLVLGCFLVDDIDGVEWVTVIDKTREYPALLYTDSSTLQLNESRKHIVDPVALVRSCKEKKLKDIYEKLREQ